MDGADVLRPQATLATAKILPTTVLLVTNAVLVTTPMQTWHALLLLLITFTGEMVTIFITLGIEHTAVKTTTALLVLPPQLPIQIQLGAHGGTTAKILKCALMVSTFILTK